MLLEQETLCAQRALQELCNPNRELVVADFAVRVNILVPTTCVSPALLVSIQLSVLIIA